MAVKVAINGFGRIGRLAFRQMFGAEGFEDVYKRQEETGYRSDDLEWLITLRTTVALCNEKIEVYVARNLIRTHQHLDENEFVNVEAHTVEELKQMIFEGKIEDSKTVAAILAYDAKYNR